MRLAIPKPTRAWLIEIGNITLGVVIALGFGELVSAVNWRRNVESARSALLFETSKSIGQGIARARAAPYIERRLDTLAAIVDTAANTGRLPAIGNITAPPIWSWVSAAWDSVGSETRAHFPRDELVTRGNAAHANQLTALINQQEMAVWLRLSTMVGPGRRIGETEIAGLRGAISEARATNQSIQALSRQFRTIAASGRFRVQPSEVRRYANRITQRSPLCGPIGNQIPAHYGLAL